MPPSPRPSVSVVIPVHNEADHLPAAIDRLLGQLEGVDADIEVVVVENGSTDGTADVVRRLAADRPGLSLMQLATPDYGAAMREGFLHTDGEWVVNFDIDYFSGAFLDGAIRRDDADVVLASKRTPGSEDHRPRFRRLATWGFNLLLRTILGSAVSDTHGMKAVRRKVIADVGPEVRSTQDLFDTELVVRAERAGYRIVEVPVRVQEERTSRSRLLRRVPRTIKGLLRMRRELG